ncbi:pectinesterase/pectinesterase inhibitor PPE8B-like isoform X2 [Actinidia eriantha]|nr:pectinesterase/pectinesterase inhibitor PPE8B-like isoform X2 [Actinidia eriantha]XP_057460421.1 pectinesterase/pectinesterase inhibitor PPE8B-like isoform X2 [Actinidia eriantha]
MVQSQNMTWLVKMLAIILLIAFFSSARRQILAIDLIVAQDGSGNFTRISDAIHAAPSFSTRRYYIRIKEGLYIENVLVGKEKTNLALIGDGMDRTVISGNKSHGGGFQTNETPTVGITGSRFIAQNVTFRNTAGPENGQAIALSIEGNRAAFYKCRFQAYQDTLYTRGLFQFFRDCEIYGTIDFIFGDATVVFQNCLIYAEKPLEFQKNTITAQKRESQSQISGTVIQNCTTTAAEDLRQQKSKFKTFLGRPWGSYSTTIIMQSFLGDIIDPKGWLEWEGRGVDKVYYAEYKNRGPGANIEGRVKWARVINSSTEAAKFSVRNFIEGDKWILSTGIPFFLDLL